jgi:phage shock protein A
MSFFANLVAWIRYLFGSVNKKMTNVQIAGESAIASSKAEYTRFTEKVVELAASLERMKKKEKEISGNIAKFERIVDRAVDAKDEKAVREALSKKKAFEQQLHTLKDDIQKSTDVYNKLTTQRDEIRQQIEEAEQGLTTLAARRQSAKYRQEAVASANGIGQSALSRLTQLNALVDEEESKATAMEEVYASGSETALLEKYGDASSDLDAEVAALMGR